MPPPLGVPNGTGQLMVTLLVPPGADTKLGKHVYIPSNVIGAGKFHYDKFCRKGLKGSDAVTRLTIGKAIEGCKHCST